MALGMEIDPTPSPKKGRSPPIFGPCLLRLNGCMDQNATWYKDRPCPEDIVLDGDPAPPPKKGAERPPQFLAHVCCGQTAGWIKMALGMKVGLDGDPAILPKKGAEPPPIIGPFLLWPKGWMHEDAS